MKSRYQPVIRMALMSLILMLPHLLLSQNRIVFTDTIDSDILDISPYAEILVDSNEAYSLISIASGMQDHLFMPADSYRSTDYLSNVVWARVVLENRSDELQKWVLADGSSNSEYFDVYQKQAHGGYLYRYSGSLISSSERNLDRYNHIVVALSLEAGQRSEILIRIKDVTNEGAAFGLALVKRDFSDSLNYETSLIIIGGFISIMGIMLLYSLMVFIMTRDLTYLYYSLYLLSLAGFILFAGGPQEIHAFPRIGVYMLFSSLSGVSVFYFLFSRHFVFTYDIIPKWDVWIKRYILLRLLLLVVQLTLIGTTYNLYLVIQIEFSFFFVDAVIAGLICIQLLRKRSRVGLFFVVGSLCVFGFGFGYFTVSIFTESNPNTILFLGAFIAEILIFSLGLGYRIKESERQKLKAQKEQLKIQEALNEELSKVNTAFGRFVPHEFLKSLGRDNAVDVQLGDSVEKEVTVFFSDIRNYTTLSESMTPRENFEFLNKYLGRVGPVIQKHGGFVNQYYGDGVMALFMDRPEQALQAAIETQQVVRDFNTERESEGLEPFRIGVGLHRGSLMMGVIGDTLRMDAGVVSDTVNTASRMEGLTKYYRAAIIASESVIGSLTDPDAYGYRFLGRVKVKGRQNSLAVYDVFEGEEGRSALLKAKSQEIFSQALERYHARDFAGAAGLFQQVLKINPLDVTASRLRERSLKFQVQAPPEDWTGEEMVRVS